MPSYAVPWRPLYEPEVGGGPTDYNKSTRPMRCELAGHKRIVVELHAPTKAMRVAAYPRNFFPNDLGKMPNHMDELSPSYEHHPTFHSRSLS